MQGQIEQQQHHSLRYIGPQHVREDVARSLKHILGRHEVQNVQQWADFEQCGAFAHEHHFLTMVAIGMKLGDY